VNLLVRAPPLVTPLANLCGVVDEVMRGSVGIRGAAASRVGCGVGPAGGGTSAGRLAGVAIMGAVGKENARGGRRGVVS